MTTKPIRHRAAADRYWPGFLAGFLIALSGYSVGIIILATLWGGR